MPDAAHSQQPKPLNEVRECCVVREGRRLKKWLPVNFSVMGLDKVREYMPERTFLHVRQADRQEASRWHASASP